MVKSPTLFPVKDTTPPKKEKRPYRKIRTPRISIVVKQHHIDDAVIKRSGHCMIAEAIKEALPEAKGVSVDLQTIRWSDPKRGVRYTYLTPRPAAVCLIQFDQEIKPKPFQFNLRGGQITTMHRGKRGKQKPVHKLGKKRLQSSDSEKKDGLIPEVIGGKPPPKWGTRREFGMRGLSMGDVFGKDNVKEPSRKLSA